MIRIKISKRLLATAVVGTALIISAVMIASMRGNDKPTITTNPPADDTQPASSPVTPVTTTDVPPTTSVAPTEPDEPASDRPGHGHHGNGNGNGNHDDDNGPADEGKARGLARAIEVHQKNIQKMTDKGKTVPQGLQMSLDKLVTMNAERLSGDQGNLLDNNGQHKGQSQGHNAGT